MDLNASDLLKRTEGLVQPDFLVRSISAASPSSTLFENSLRDAASGTENFQGIGSEPGAEPMGNTSRIDRSLKDLEALLVAQMLEPMFRATAEGTFGDGPQGDFLTQMFVKQISQSIVGKGDFGLAEHLNINASDMSG